MQPPSIPAARKANCRRPHRSRTSGRGALISAFGPAACVRARARTRSKFKEDTVRWFLLNSEHVGDMASMMWIAMLVGFGVTGMMLYMFTEKNLGQFAVLQAMGATPRLLTTMILVQAAVCAVLGTGIGLGVCAVVGRVAAAEFEYPFRMMWFAALIGGGMVVLVSIVAAAISIRPVFRLQPARVFAGR